MKKTKNKVSGPTKKVSLKAGLSKGKSFSARAKIVGPKHLRLVEHKHTGKLIHSKNTSHLSLFIILSLLGVFLLVCSANVAKAQLNSGSVSVGMTVRGDPPKAGATIIKPVDGTKITDTNIYEVSGTCEKDSFVVIKDNNNLVGSTSCTEAGIFVLQVQLQSGDNTLSALNYDSFDQSGPVTKTATVYVDIKTSNITTSVVSKEVVVPILPSNPSIIDGTILDTGYSKTQCDSYDAGVVATGGEPHVSIVCVPRTFLPKIEQTMGILVWGGTPPYAVSVDLGDGSDSLLFSIQNAGYSKEKFVYASAGSYKIGLKLKDTDKNLAIVQTAVQVSGSASTATSSNNAISTIISNISDLSPFEMSVPFYLLAVAITLGFWCGDVFERNFGKDKKLNKAKKAV